MNDRSPDEQLAEFIDRYTPEIAARARACLARMRVRLPGAVELVYDNYNALAIGFGPHEKRGDILFSITLYPRWVSLFFMYGAGLPDPEKVLKGSGSQVRHIVIDDPADLDKPAVQALLAEAIRRADVQIDETQSGRLVIKSISPKQQPRRPRK
ncbi:MAG: hypothetical protein ACKV2V_31475 [Blastocatellia bacterium]